MFDHPSSTLTGDDEGPLGTLRELARAARASTEVDWSGESSLALVEAAEILTRVTNQLVATDAGVVEAYARSGDWRLDGHRSPTAGLETETGTSSSRARKRVAVARNSTAMPETVAALASGDLALEHQGVLADALATARRADDQAAFERDEKLLVEHARRLHFDAFRSAIEGWKACVDPDGTDREAMEREARRDIKTSKTLGGYDMRGLLHSMTGHEIVAEAERIGQHLFGQDWAEARARVGDDATKDDLRRTAAQRRHDAFVEMARRSRSAEVDGLARAPKAVVNIHTDHHTAMAEMARHEGRPYAYGAERLCELEDGTVIPPSSMLSSALAGEVRRIVWGGDGHIIDFGRSRRLATATLRQALFARDRACAHPGCHLPARRCEADHREEWDADDGPTSLENLDALCDFHNRWKSRHRSQWRDLSRRFPRSNRRWN